MSAPADAAGRPNWVPQAERAVGDAVQRLLPGASPALVTLLAAAVRHAHADERRRELVVDIQAVLSVLAGPPGDDDLPDSHLLADWLNREGRLVMVEERIGTAGPLPPVLSDSMRGQVLPRTAALAGNGPAGVWHLLMALAELDETQWPPMAPEPIDSAALKRLRAVLAERGPGRPGVTMGRPAAAAPAGLPEATPLLSDNPSGDDLLGRRPLVQALAIRLARLQAEEAASPEPAAVMVHLHGAWGSGKSSMVKLLRHELEYADRPWLVVEFNAWRNTRAKPPWWNMLLAVQDALLKAAWPRGEAYPAAPLPHWFWLKAEFALWRMTQEAAKFATAVTAFLGFFALWAFAPSIDLPSDDFTTAAKEWTGFVGSILSALFVVRAWFLGGKPTAEAFDALRTDALRPFIRLFERLVGLSGRPIMIVLDDLDRCNADTVTDLLEGIQTLFRGAPVVFLAVADRRWITASFSKRFAEFQEAGGYAARPVGDLFLDKMFQLSFGVPQMRPEAKEIYLRRLLELSDKPPATPPPTLPPEVQSFAAGLNAIADAPKEQKAAVAGQVARRMAEQQSDNETRHKLEEFLADIDANPRAMKRLINAISMAKAVASVEQRFVEFDTLVLWTMLDLGWPHVIEAIRIAPDVAKAVKNSTPETASSASAAPPTNDHGSGNETHNERARRLLAHALQDPQFNAIWTRLPELGMAQMLTAPLPPEDP